MHQDGFGLVVGIVSHCDGAGRLGLRHASQEAVPSAPGSLLQRQTMLVCQGSNVATLDMTGQHPLARGGPDKVGIGVGICPPKSVVQVGDDEREPVLCPEPAQQVEQAQRIGAARHADDHGIARPQ